MLFSRGAGTTDRVQEARERLFGARSSLSRTQSELAALNGAIERGEYQKVLARWGEQGEAVTQSEVNPPGITY